MEGWTKEKKITGAEKRQTSNKKERERERERERRMNEWLKKEKKWNNK